LFLFYSKHKNKVFVIKLGEKTKQNMYLQRTTLKKIKEPAHHDFSHDAASAFANQENKTKAEAH